MLKLTDVYVWELPVRLSHWVNAACLIVLSFTGYYIGHPYIDSVHPLFYGTNPHNQFIMGWMRLVHFAAAYVFAMGVLLRIYWGFVGNKYARWSAMIPYTRGRLTELYYDLRFYLLLDPRPPYVVGHSILAGIAYVVLFLGYLVSILTGFALMSQSHVGFFWKVVGGWILPYFPVQEVRLVHHFIMWFLIVFPIVHMYIGWTTDLVEDNCVMSSIFSGHKTCREE
jgi:Ni/Fe-hydrogenase 1 B-type cytochrome subunit